MHHQRSELRAAVNKALDAFIELHKADEGGDPRKLGHGGLVTETSIKARDEVARLRAAERELEGVIEVIRSHVPIAIRRTGDGRLVATSFAGAVHIETDLGDGLFLYEQVVKHIVAPRIASRRTDIAPVDTDEL